MQRIQPCFWFDFTAEAAAKFYQHALMRTTLVSTLYYPTEGLPPFQKDFAGLPLAIKLSIDGYECSLINAGDAYTPNPSLSMMLHFDPKTNPKAEAELHQTWQALSEKGHVHVPLGTHPFSPLYGWVQDQFGVNWQLILSNNYFTPATHVMPCLLFINTTQNKARNALDLYSEAFEGAQLGTLITYKHSNDTIHPGAVRYSELQLYGQTFALIDADRTGDFTFTPGASLLIRCESQAEIDQLWDWLSATPSAEQCGWCRDEFGFSWQVVPANFAELLQQPVAYEKMLKMKKIVLADLD